MHIVAEPSISSISDLMPVQIQELEVQPQAAVESLLLSAKSLDHLPSLGDTIMGPEDSPIGILMIHGFTGSNLEQYYLANALALRGYRVFTPLLPGHGKSYRELKETTAEDWYAKVVASYHYLQGEVEGRKMVIIGHSMGGTLAMRLAVDYPSISAVFSLAGPVKYNPFVVAFFKVLNFFKVTIRYDGYKFADKRLKHNPGVMFMEHNYHKMPVSCIAEVGKIMEDVESHLEEITSPLSLIYAKNDYLIPGNQMDLISETVNSHQIQKVWLENSNHIVVIDVDKDVVLESILSFLFDLELVI